MNLTCEQFWMMVDRAESALWERMARAAAEYWDTSLGTPAIVESLRQLLGGP